MLGELYRKEASVFGKDPDELNEMLRVFTGFGFSNVAIIGICMVFPHVFGGDPELSGEISALFDDLRRVFVDYDLLGCGEQNVNAYIEVCRKIRVFYDLGCQKGKMVELIGRNKNVFVRCPEEVLVNKIEFFLRLGVDKSDVGMLVLERPEILDFNLEETVISVLGFLKHFGMSINELKYIAKEFPYVLGRNKMVNLPYIMRALDKHEWFFNEMRTGNHHLLCTYAIGNSTEDLNEDYQGGLDKILSSRTPIHGQSKLSFLHSIGFGENTLTLKVLVHLHGTSTELQERFDCLLCTGIRFSKLCKMLRLSPKILNQKPEILEQKMKFLCEDKGSLWKYLDVFPAFLCYDLEKRIKPRYRFHIWLTEKGLCAKQYSLASMIATSEKNFVARVYGIHPAAPKHWFECFSKPNHINDKV